MLRPLFFLAALAVFDFSFDKHHNCSKSNFSSRENVSSQEPISGRASARLHCDLCFLPPFSRSEGERLRERLVGERTCCPLFSSPPRVIWQLKCPTPDEVQEFASLPRSSLRSKRFQSSYCAKVRAEAFFALVPAF